MKQAQSSIKSTRHQKKLLRGAVALCTALLCLALPLRFAAAEEEETPQVLVVVVATEAQQQPAEANQPTPQESASASDSAIEPQEAVPIEPASIETTPTEPATDEPTPLPTATPAATPAPDGEKPIYVANEYLFYSNDPALAQSLCLQYGGELLRWSDGLGVMYCDSLSDDSGLFYPQEIYLVSSGPYLEQPGETATNIASAQNLAEDAGAGVVIAVIDSGIDLDHPALVNSIVEAVSIIPDSAYGDGGYFYEGYQGAQDYEGHGSHVSGILVGQTEEMTLGIAPQADIISIKALEKYGSAAAGTTEWLIRAILYAISRNVDIINLSVGGSKSYVSAAQVAFQQAADAGILVVCATGNSTNGPSDTIDYPAAYDNTLAITSVTVGEDGTALSGFSNYGPGTDLSAPGVAIYSCDADGQYQTLSGTSMSCAVATGVAALLLSQEPDLTPDELVQIMEQTATDAGAVGYDTTFGWGVVNAEAALLQMQHGGTTNPTNPAPQQSAVPQPVAPSEPEIAAKDDWLTTQEKGAPTQQAAQNTLGVQKSQSSLPIILAVLGLCLAGVIVFFVLRLRNQRQPGKQG